MDDFLHNDHNPLGSHDPHHLTLSQPLPIHHSFLDHNSPDSPMDSLHSILAMQSIIDPNQYQQILQAHQMQQQQQQQQQQHPQHQQSQQQLPPGPQSQNLPSVSATQALLEQQMKLTHQLQQLQNQIFQQQLELISGQGSGNNMSSTIDSSQTYRDNPYGLPTPASSADLRAQVSPNFMSPIILTDGVNTPLDTPLSHYFSSPNPLPQGTSSAPAHIAFNTAEPLSHRDMDLDLSPITSPWFGAHPERPSDHGSSSSSGLIQSTTPVTSGASMGTPTTGTGTPSGRISAARLRTGTKRAASSSGDDGSPLPSGANPTTKKHNSAARRTTASAGSRSGIATRNSTSRNRKGSSATAQTGGGSTTPGVGSTDISAMAGGLDTPSPVDLSMPPPAPPQHLQQQQQQQQNQGSNNNDSRSGMISPVTPASLMKLGTLGLSSALSPNSGIDMDNGISMAMGMNMNMGFGVGGGMNAMGAASTSQASSVYPGSGSGSNSVTGPPGSGGVANSGPGMRRVETVGGGTGSTTTTKKQLARRASTGGTAAPGLAKTAGRKGVATGLASSSSTSASASSSTTTTTTGPSPRKLLLPGGVSASHASQLASRSNYSHHLAGTSSSLNLTPSTPLPAPPIQVRKESHKDAEQKRRDALKLSYDELRLLLPPLPLPSEEGYEGEPILPGSMPPRGPPRGDTLGPNRSASKLQLLRCGNSFIKQLKGCVERRDGFIEEMKREIVVLRRLVGEEALKDAVEAGLFASNPEDTCDGEVGGEVGEEEVTDGQIYGSGGGLLDLDRVLEGPDILTGSSAMAAASLTPKLGPSLGGGGSVMSSVPTLSLSASAVEEDDGGE